MRYGLLSGVATIGLCIAGAAPAQTTPTQETASGPEGEANEIVVTGQRAQQQRAIAAKRDAIGIVDVATADEVGRLPDRNVAEVVERLPGVGVTYDQGEGRYVSIRGVPSALNNYTLNGIEIGNPDGTTRALPLDIVSGQLLRQVEVAKVKTADMDGQGIGGTVNLVTQTAFDYQDAFALSVNAQAGYQELNKKVPVRGDASVAKRFGADEQFGIVLGGSYSYRDFDSEGFYPDNWKPVAGAARGGLPDNIKYTRYSLERERYAGTGSFDWRPSDTQKFYARALYSRFVEDEVRPRYRLDFTLSPYTLNPDGVTGTTRGTATPANGVGAGTGPERREDLRLDYKAKSLLTAILGGESVIDRLTIAYAGAYGHNKVLDRYPLWQFRCNPGTVDFDFSKEIYTATPRTECTPQQMQFRQYQNFRQQGTEDIWQGRLDGTYNIAGGALDQGSFVKFGGKYRDTDRRFDQRNDTYTRGSTTATRFTLGQFALQGRDATVYPDDGDTDRGYLNSPTIDPAAIRAFTAANLPGPLFVLDAATTRANATLADFDLSERVVAGYAMANLKRGAITIVPGVRYEDTRLRVTGFQLANGTTITPLTRVNTYHDLLPELLVRIKPARDVVFRLAYSRSLGRPEYANLSPGGSLNTVDQTVSIGNPDLKPYRADNLDAIGEWYFARGGLFSVGVFGKFIRNPIFVQSVTGTNVTYNGTLFSRLTISQPLNAERGDIVGIEAQLLQQFTFLPGVLSGLGVQLTGTLTDSTLRLPDGRGSSFPSQSDYLYGAELFYQRGIVEASVAYHNTGKALLTAGTQAFQDQYNNDLRRLDAKVSFALLRQARLFFEAQNLTDEPTRQYQGGRTDWVIQNERYGRTFYAGVSASF